MSPLDINFGHALWASRLEGNRYTVAKNYHSHFTKWVYSAFLYTVAQFMHVLRQRIQLGATESIYLMVNGITPTTRYKFIDSMLHNEAMESSK